MPSSSSPRSTAIGAYLEGWRRALASPHVVAALFVATVAVSLPLAVAMGAAMESHLGSSLTGESALRGWDDEWAGELAAGRTDVTSTFTHEILGFGGTLAALSRFVDGQPPPALLGAVATYLVVWVFLSGGVIDRLARARALSADRFLATCGRFALRLARVALVAGLGYWALFRWLYPFVFGVLVPWVAGETPSGARLVTLRAVGYGLFLSALGFLTLVADMSRVRLVVEDRYSALAAWSAGWRFVRRRFGRLSLLFVLNIVGQAVLLRVWLQVSPGAGSPDWVAVGVTQVYLVARLWARLAFVASEVVFFQGELAHATYAAAPEPMWPDSASVEALRNLRQAADAGRPPRLR